MNPLEVLPDRKKQLLLARFNGEEVENGVIITSPSPVNNTPVNTEKESADIGSINSVPTRLDSFASPREGSRHDSNSSDAGSRSSSRLSIKENRQSNADRDGSAKRPLEFDSSDSIGMREEKAPKTKRADRTIESPEPEKVVTVVADSNSRGAGGIKNTLKKYFTSTSDKPPADNANSFHHISQPNHSNNATTTATTTAPHTEAGSMPPPSAKPSAPLPGSSTAHLHAQTNSHPTANHTSSGSAKNTAPSGQLANITTQQQQLQITTIVELKKQSDALKIAKDQAESKATRIEEEFRGFVDKYRQLEDKNTRMTKALEEVQRSLALQEMRRRRDKLALDNVRLGRMVQVRTNLGVTQNSDSLEGGYRRAELERQKVALKERKDELEARRKRIISMKKRAARKAGGAANSNSTNDVLQEFGLTGEGSAFSMTTHNGSSNSLSAMNGGSERSSNTTTSNNNQDKERDVMDNDMDLNTETEVIRIHLEQLKKDELAFNEEERAYESEKAVHLKELKRCYCEENSHFFKELPVLNDRYLLQSMLGRGGFSEVWKAYDLVELKEVAVKVHQLNNQWSEERKHSYIKHVTREYTIHKDMKHPRVVQLFDVFEIDGTAFATVLEYCRGIDLDEKLKRLKTIPEKDAKAIFMQIMSGLRYLNRPLSYLNKKDDRYVKDEDNDVDNNNNNNNANNNNNLSSNNNMGGMGSGSGRKKMAIIHFDLKPANILFDEVGDVKITDFGLSKIIDDTNEGTSMELTSQGAGTYWYLPPECFAKGSEAPRISSKVDVWSAGIIFYQMLYGKRPYGENVSQDRIWKDNLIGNAGDVVFSNMPKVSDEAKDLIRQCLTKDPRARPDVVAVCQHPYLNK